MLRPAVVSDATVIAAIYLAARREAMPYLPELHTEDEVRVRAGRLLPHAIVWVAETDGEVAGYLAELGVTHVYLSPVQQAAPGS